VKKHERDRAANVVVSYHGDGLGRRSKEDRNTVVDLG